jgi:hypothetical protein
MRTRYAIVTLALVWLVCLIGGLIVGILAKDLFPHYAGPLVLVGVLALGVPIGLLLGRRLRRGDRQKHATRLRQSEGAICCACAVASLGCLIGTIGSGRGALGVAGLIVAAGGFIAAFWILLKAAPDA